MIYTVYIKETLEKCVPVNAPNEEMAILMVEEKYRDEEIVLNSENNVDVEFGLCEDC